MKYPALEAYLIQAEGEMDAPEEKVDTSAFVGSFELTPEVSEFISEYKLEDEIEKEGEESAKLKPNIAEELAKTSNLFKSREIANGRMEGMEESIKEMVLEIGKEEAPEFEFAVDVTYDDSDIGNPASFYKVQISKGNQEEELDILYYTYEPGIALAEGADSWNWAAWLGIEASPFFDEQMSEDYDYDQMSISLEEMLATFKESQDYWDLKDLIKKLEDSYTPEYKYVIDADERGEFRAHVEDDKGAVIYEIKNEEENEDGEMESGEIPEVRDGYMRHNTDVDGLEKYLKEMGTIPKNAKLEEA